MAGTPGTLAAALRKVPAALDDAAAAALDDLGGQLVRAAQQAAPKDSGRLRQAIRADTAGGVVTVSADTPYAATIHNGSTRRGIRPTPFLADPLRKLDHSGGIEQTFTRHIDDEIGALL
jgi:hypothetical protein